MKTDTFPLVSLARNRPVTTSLVVAEKFHKRHKTVLRKIENIDGPKSFTERNFALSEYTDPSGRKLPMYLMTRDGFTLLAMSFTGREATKWKIKYINAFNAMEAALVRRKNGDWREIRNQGKVAQALPHRFRPAAGRVQTYKSCRDMPHRDKHKIDRTTEVMRMKMTLSAMRQDLAAMGRTIDALDVQIDRLAVDDDPVAAKLGPTDWISEIDSWVGERKVPFHSRRPW